MTTSETGTCNKPSSSGFTLLELMAVIFIAGMMIGLLLINIPGRTEGEVAMREAQRIKALVDLAREEAILNTAILGIRFDHTSYRFMKLADKKWTDLEDRLLRRRKLDETLNLEFEQIEDTDPEQIEQSEQKKDDDDELPQVAVYPTGELTPFRLTLESVGSPIAVFIEARTSGILTIEQQGEQL